MPLTWGFALSSPENVPGSREIRSKPLSAQAADLGVCNSRRPQLERLVVDYIDHYNAHRPHRALDQLPPVATDAANRPDGHLQVVRTARCGGLINEYRNAA